MTQRSRISATRAHLFARATGGGRKRLLIQALGILISIALLAWTIAGVLKPENRAKLSSVTHAPPASLALLIGLSLVSLACNGTAFWLTLSAVRRVPFFGTQAANAIASFLAYLPFKLSVISRLVIHHRRDGVPIVALGAWLAANAVLVLGIFGCVTVARLWRGSVDVVFAAAAAGLLIVFGMTLCFAARLFAGEAGRARYHALAGKLGLLGRLMVAPVFAHLLAGFDILARPSVVGGVTLVRLIDIAAQAGRFVVAAAIINVPLTWSSALLPAVAFFIIGASNPAGAVGGREGGTSGIAALLHLESVVSLGDFKVITLVVSGSEILLYTVTAILSAIYVRPDKLALRQAPPASP
ncbi:MAG: hypothetical protein WC718_10520 [Phycisphaerales bacterium]|jgi:hypothetical protein